MATALLVIGAQKIYTNPRSEMYCKDSRKTVDRINRLIASFAERRAPVVYVRHIHKADGSDTGRLFDYAGEATEDFNFKEGTEEVEYDSRLTRLADAPEIVKTRYSAFAKTGLAELLKSRQIDRLAICGFMTNFCCESTARDALDLDYYVDFVLDATGSPGTEHLDESKVRKVVGELLAEGFAVVMNTDDYLKRR